MQSSARWCARIDAARRSGSGCGRGRGAGCENAARSAVNWPCASSVWLTLSLASFSAKLGRVAIRAGHGHRDSRSSSRGTTWLTMPSRRASSAVTKSPVNSSSLALRAPELPRVGEVLDAVDAHADHRVGEQRVVGGDDDVGDPQQHQPAGDGLALGGGDHRLGDVAPPPAHLEVDLLLQRHVPLLALAAEAAVGRHEVELAEVSRSRRSWPLEKCGPSACRTITFTSVRRERVVERSVEVIRLFCALRRSGRSSVTTATPCSPGSSTSYRMVDRWSSDTVMVTPFAEGPAPGGGPFSSCGAAGLSSRTR